MILAVCCLLLCGAGPAETDGETIRQRMRELEQELPETTEDFQIYVYEASEQPEALPEDAPPEKKFTADFAGALEARWRLTSHEPPNLTPDQTRNIYRKYVETELGILQKYEDTDFGDPFLGLLAKAYLKALNNQNLAVSEYYGRNDSLYNEYWSAKGKNPRTVIIYLMEQYYQVHVSAKYANELENAVIAGYLLSLSDPVPDLMALISEPERPAGAGVTDGEEQGDASGRNAETITGPIPGTTPEPTPIPTVGPGSWQVLEASPAADFIYVNNGEEVQINGYTGPGGNIRIPDEIEGNPVTRIAVEAFKNNQTITGLVLPKDLHFIGNNAFYRCEKLTGSLVIPRNTVKVEGHAFQSTDLTNIAILSGCELGVNAFANLDNLESVYIMKGCSPVFSQAVIGYSSGLTELVVPNEACEIHDKNFSASNLLTIYTPAGSYAEEYAKRNFIRCNTEEYEKVNREYRERYGIVSEPIPEPTAEPTPIPSPTPEPTFAPVP